MDHQTGNETHEISQGKPSQGKPSKRKRALARTDEKLAAGARYVAEYLPDVSEHQASWIVEEIGSGKLIACPRCHFLHLGGGKKHQENCDICGHFGAARATLNYNIRKNIHKHTEEEWLAPELVNQIRDMARFSVPIQRHKRADALYNALLVEVINSGRALAFADLKETMRQETGQQQP